MKVLSFGSLNIDYVYRVPHFVAAGETLAAESLSVFSGGKGLNQSIAMAKAGLDVYHAGAVGTEGAFLVEELRKAGVNVKNILMREDVRTGHAIIQNDRAGENCILLFGGANRSISQDEIDRVLSHFSRGDVLVAQNEVNGLPYLLEQARKAGLFIVLNPSPMEDALIPLIPFVDLLILNEVEASQIVGETLAPANLAERLHSQYPSLRLVLTAGAEGAYFIHGETRVFEPARKVDVVDTTAAGDTFTGYFLAGYFEGDGAADAGKCEGGNAAFAMGFATVAASIAVTRSGASPSIPGREEVVERIAEEHL